MAVSIANSTALTLCNAIVDPVDVGGAGTLVIYDGTVPANVDAALSGNTVLAQLGLSSPAFGDAVDATPNATATANAITSDTEADGNGVPSFFRFLSGGGTPVIQGTAGTSGTDLILSASSIEIGDVVQVTSLTVTVNEAN